MFGCNTVDHKWYCLKILNKADYTYFSDLYLVYLKTICDLNWKLTFCSKAASLKIWVSKVQDFENTKSLVLLKPDFSCFFVNSVNSDQLASDEAS